ncbi:DUF4184 family protein [Pseudolysinimonas yzui]|uniref:DUF4184 family protein n=1 Tax=Pseudolysinimonas yzui TaxID=2708254 RepID=A0A8J3GQ65_9MICO|nr:DUF4184 family protein [Pseudolysinimonas yzui]GHF14951.1 hypothetical protein GCM10011600_14910 [Pseudolysinimonas yzui]
MPFTPSHAIVALPFIRTPIPAGAVAVGAMAPDLPLFFPWVAPYSVTHGFPGLLVVSVPLALVLYAVWRLVIRPAASALLLPEALRARMPWAWDRVGRPERPVRSAVLLVVAALIGVVTHVFWDLFTHPDRLGSEWFPVLGEQWGPVDGTTWLQQGFSALGLAVVAAWAVLALRRAGVVHRTDPPAVGIVRVAAWMSAGLLLLGSFAAHVARDGVPGSYAQLRDTAFDAGTLAGAAILVLTLAASVVVRLLRRAG